MKITFWGVRGSIPTPLTNNEYQGKVKEILELWKSSETDNQGDIDQFIGNLPWYLRNTVGGNTTCIEVEAGGKIIILDAGSGIRPLGLSLMGRAKGKPLDIHIMISHTHWDHICGFPFFVPAYIPGNTVTFYGVHPNLEKRITGQQDPTYFPVQLSMMASTIQFRQLEYKEEFSIGDVAIKTHPLLHPGGSYGYRIDHGGKSFVFATDSEYKDLTTEGLQPYTQFFKNAHALYFDAQYTLAENVEKEDWGHSNAFVGIDMALAATVKQIYFAHHEPVNNDRRLWEIEQKTSDYLEMQEAEHPLKFAFAREGESFEI